MIWLAALVVLHVLMIKTTRPQWGSWVTVMPEAAGRSVLTARPSTILAGPVLFGHLGWDASH